MSSLLLALIFGFGFGWALDKAGLGQYGKIANVFRFKDLTVIKFMMTTLCVAMIGVYGLTSIGVLEMTRINETFVVGNLVGGLIFGVGMALAGF